MLIPPSNNYQGISRFTFQNFISFDTNVEARQTAIKFSDNENTGFDVLVISGTVGIGKTHLACAVLNEIEARNPNAPILLISYEKLINLMRKNLAQEFLNTNFLNRVSLLLIDGYFIPEPKKADYIDFDNIIFATIKQSNCKTIITTVNGKIDFPCNRINLNFDPTEDELIAIIKKQKTYLDVEINEEIINYMSTVKYPCPRIIENELVSIKAYSDLENKKMDMLFFKTRIPNLNHKYG